MYLSNLNQNQNYLMKNLRSIFFTFCAVFILNLSGYAQESTAEPKILGLMFHSDFCGSCKILDPKLQAVKPLFAEENVLFVTFDHTSKETSRQAALLAERLDVGEVYRAQKKASGFLLVLDADSGEVLGKITREHSEADMKMQLSDALN